MKRIILTVLIILASYGGLFAQVGLPRELRKAAAAPDEIVSFSQTTAFNYAIQVLNDLSKTYLGKVLVDPEGRTHPIGIDINRMHWMTALELILKKNNLWYEQHEDYIKIIPIEDDVTKMSKEELAAAERYNKREVVISAVFFEADVSKLREMGMSWLFKRGSDVNLSATNVSSGGLNFTNQDGNQNGNSNNQQNQETGKLFQLKFEPKNLVFGDVRATFDALENNSAGEIIASPQVTVGSGETGRIQVGSDIAVTVQDFAGNAVTQFFSTGSIIKVTPEVVKHDSVEFIYLDLEIERSSSARDAEGGLEIRKSLANTRIMLLDGEETIIGGLFINEESRSRVGIPLLKDLPWWFLGLRYFFGYESKSLVKKELLILIHAELLPTLEERFKAQASGLIETEKLRQAREKGRKKLEEYRQQIQLQEKYK
jgi:type IV pilus assembly protein PilQ